MDIRSVLQEKGISIKELAERIGTTSGAVISRIDGNPTANALEELANAIGCQVGDFFPSQEEVLTLTPPDLSPTPSSPEIICPRCGERICLSVKASSDTDDER